jgi:hypothetical protein
MEQEKAPIKMLTVILHGSRPLSEWCAIVAVDGHAPFFRAVMRSFVLSSLVNGTALRNAVVVTLEEHDGVGGQVKDTLDGFAAQKLAVYPHKCSEHYKPNFHVAPTVVLGPDTQDIFLSSNAENSSANLVAGFHELVANHGKEEVLPVAIANTFLQPHYELAAFAICFVFPDRTDALSEEVVVRHTWQHGRTFEMGVDCPKVLHRVHTTQGLNGFFIIRIFGSRRPIPDNPRVFKWKW